MINGDAIVTQIIGEKQTCKAILGSYIANALVLPIGDKGSFESASDQSDQRLSRPPQSDVDRASGRKNAVECQADSGNGRTLEKIIYAASSSYRMVFCRLFRIN